MSKAIPSLLMLAAAILCESVSAGDRMDSEHDRNWITLGDEFPDEPSNFWQRFQLAYDQRSDEVFADRLDSLKIMRWTIKRPRDSWEQFVERANRAAQSAMMKSIEYSLRDAAIGLPIMSWIESREDALGELLTDSVDAVEEESIAPLDPLYQPTARLWWQALAEKRELRYGIRPFRTDPYAFLSLRIKDADRVLLMGHVRYYYRNFADHRFELALSMPLPKGFTADVGTSYQFGRHKDERRFVFKLFKPLRHGGIAHVGLELQNTVTVFAGVSMPL